MAFSECSKRGRRGMKTFLYILAIFFLFPGSGDVAASDLRCGSRLVSIGDHRFDVLRKCGEPAHVETWEEVRVKRNLLLSSPLTPEQELILQSPLSRELVIIEEWQYNFGQNRFIRYLRFENGRLKRIETGDYGY